MTVNLTDTGPSCAPLVLAHSKLASVNTGLFAHRQLMNPCDEADLAERTAFSAGT